MEMKLNGKTVLMIRRLTAVASELMAAAERLAPSSLDEGTLGIARAKGWYAFACCSPE